MTEDYLSDLDVEDVEDSYDDKYKELFKKYYEYKKINGEEIVICDIFITVNKEDIYKLAKNNPDNAVGLLVQDYNKDLENIYMDYAKDQSGKSKNTFIEEYIFNILEENNKNDTVTLKTTKYRGIYLSNENRIIIDNHLEYEMTETLKEKFNFYDNYKIIIKCDRYPDILPELVDYL